MNRKSFGDRLSLGGFLLLYNLVVLDSYESITGGRKDDSKT
jgi:hypothetical protein